jgi:hypothetical protein
MYVDQARLRNEERDQLHLQRRSTASLSRLLAQSARLVLRSQSLQAHARDLTQRFAALNDRCVRRLGR